MLRQSPGGKDAAYPFAHQVELLYKLFARKPLKVLIGDEIGLGKTIEAIMLLKYLQEVGEVKKALILVPRIIINQWESELRRFGIEAQRIERNTIDRLVSRGFPDGVYLSSIDLVKRDNYKQKVLNIKWDIVIADEAHRIGIVGTFMKKPLCSSPANS
jgi:SNF2 family DNA or RNA helicase